ncbi:MAG: PilZ domain-containing protein [Pseudomonadota bacterium]
MVIVKEDAERRQYERHELEDRFFITFRPHLDRIGWLVDISKGGVSLEYSNIEDCSPLTEDVVVDIFSAPKSFKLANLPCQLVYDSRVVRGRSFIETTETRRCGLVFGDLSQDQTAQLDVALNHCTVGSSAENMEFHQPEHHMD